MLETLYVVKIINTHSIPLHYWYRNKDEDLFICRFKMDQQKFSTFNQIDDLTYGHIEREHAEIISEFQYDED